ncbi:histidine phosphatase family protein [Rhodoferax sp. PAMC 29310]|uniref:histidine phosphatase family protein n=1 Tax=Rhodoferax sp. PAMC 29310 TaxID=2822760 RepID=UPI001B33C68E|nr:histidine phosphatase family protein [Rhodoferax sp. PAMC 29310]
MKLWLVRHAQPLIDAGVCYGATDVAADAEATLAAAQTLALQLPVSTTMWVSTLQRCEQLAQEVKGLRPDLAYKTDDRLREMDFGHWEAQPWSAIPPEAYDAWTADFGGHRFGGKESVTDFMNRVALAWDEIQGQSQDGVWITHAGVIRAVSLLAQGTRQIADAAQWPAQAPGFGQWTVVDR